MGRVTVDALRDFERRMRHRRVLNLVLEVGVTGKAEGRTPTLDQPGKRTEVAAGARVLERGVNRTGCEQGADRRPMRIVTLDACQRRHVGTEMGCDEIRVRIVAHETKPRHRRGQLEGLGTPVRIMAGRATLGSSLMGPVSLHAFLHITVA